ncbi:MAG TPA: protein kinase [Pyrinomonadaceae bacterium]|nr:protein kinase [Pyrinomonadaceae bacterium]
MSKVSAQYWQQVKDVFEGALQRRDAERSEFLDQACAGDSELRREVESLLKSHEEAGSFMEVPAVASAAESLIGEQNKLRVGQVVNHYEILAAIGEGGMGEVYLAKDTVLGRRVALKLLPEYVSKDPDRLRRFKQEARTASTLSHPNVCVVHEIGQSDDGRPFITMEYIEGVTLRQRMQDRPMKLNEAIDIAIQIADALTAAHEAGIVHRDIKPENIIIRRDGYLKVLDFGLAKLTEPTRLNTNDSMSTLLVHSSPGMVMGTAAYMSPEQARGLPVDEHTDIWSLGVVLYEMVSGQPPFTGPTPTDVVVAIVEKEQKPLSEQVEDVPYELERIVRKALRKDTDQRYQIVKEMAIDLRSLRRDIEIHRSVAPNLSEHDKSFPSRSSSAAVATGTDRAWDTNAREAARATVVEAPLVRKKRWGTFAVILVAGVVIAGAGFWVYKKFSAPDTANPSSSHFRKVNVTKVTTNGNALFASISPDGKYVAYIKSEGGKESLWLRQVEGAGHLQVLPPIEGHYYGLAFSPEGNFIYYGYSETGDSNVSEIYKVPVLGAGAPPVKVNLEDGPTSFSHAGNRVAFVRRSLESRTDTLVIANADRTNEQNLASRKWPDRFSWEMSTRPAWSEDDQRVALPLVNSDANGFFISIYEMRLADRTEKITPLSAQHFQEPGVISLTSDARGVVLSARAQGASFQQLWYLGIDGSARTITNDLSDYRGAFLTADSKSLVSVQTQVLSNIWALTKGEGGDPTQITSGVGRYFDMGWAPDGKVLYASDASGNADIYEMALNGTGVRQLTSGMKRNYAPSVSPDNRFVVFHSNRSGIFQIWRMDRDGSNPVQLTTGNSESNWPQVSPDGKYVIFQHFESAASGTLWKVPIEGGQPIRIAEGFAVRPAISPDGKWLGFWQNDGQPNSRWRVGVISLEDGKVRTFGLAPTVPVQWDTPLRWTPDSQSVAYIDSRGGVDNIWAQPTAGTSPKQLTNFTGSRIFSFDWSREGDLIASRGVITSDVVLISDVGR